MGGGAAAAGNSSGAMIDGTAPSVRGAPGAFGLCVGSKASERRPGAAGGGAIGAVGWMAPRGMPACTAGRAPPRRSISSCSPFTVASSC